MSNVIISLASNHDQTENLPLALRRLGQIIHIQRATEAIWTEPFHSPIHDLYLNQLVYADTHLSADQLTSLFKRIELTMGRTPEERQQGIVRIDIDLLQYDHQRYHMKDWERPYIKQLLNK